MNACGRRQVPCPAELVYTSGGIIGCGVPFAKPSRRPYNRPMPQAKNAQAVAEADVAAFLARLRALPDYAGQIVHDEVIPPCAPVYGR